MKKTLLALLCATSLSTTNASAQSNGDSPEGRPFAALTAAVEDLLGRMSTLESRVEVLTGRVDTVENAVAVNSLAIDVLEKEIAALEMEFFYSLDEVRAKIASLENEIGLLQDQVDANTGDVSRLEMEIAAKAMLLMDLARRVADVEGGLTTLDQALQDQIDQNTALLDKLQSALTVVQGDLAEKQDRVNGVCPDGLAVHSIGANGEVNCTSVGVDGSDLIRLSQTVTAGRASTIATLQCPLGSTAIDGGFGQLNPDTKLIAARTGGRLYVVNVLVSPLDGEDTFTAEALCLKI